MANNLSPDTTVSDINNIQTRLRRLENSPQVGHQSIQEGSLDILDNLGNLLMSYGVQPDGSLGLALYNPVTGVKIMQLGQDLATGFYGLSSFNAAGTKTVQVGQINASPVQYGMTVLAPTGALQKVAGTDSAAVNGPLTFSGAPSPPLSFVDLGGPSVTADIGPSGQALVAIFALTQLGADSTLIASVGVDGSLVPPLAAPFIENLATSGNGLTLASTGTMTGLAAGSHTFKMVFTCDGGSASFSGNEIVVTPL
jgi:hypothetical protein